MLFTTLCLFSWGALACREQPADRRAPEQALAPVSAKPAAPPKPARVRRPAPTGAFGCSELRQAPKAEGEVVPEAIELAPLGTGKIVSYSKTGERVAFDREQFLQAARCMKLERAILYVEEETGREHESPIMDAFQLSYVAAALLDVGRAAVRLEDESVWQKAILRDEWAADGCAGRCRSGGRVYRLADDDPAPFLQVADYGRNF